MTDFGKNDVLEVFIRSSGHLKESSRTTNHIIQHGYSSAAYAEG
jgi:hypothetical protein